MIVRRAGLADVAEVARLCAAHAAYEQAPPVPDNLAEVIAAPHPRLWCLVATRHGAVIAYLTMTLEFSTWRAQEYRYLDCLFVDEAHRGLGVGGSLLSAAVSQTRDLGLDEMQWQTPAWNADAIRFYDRTGATSSPKRRYTLRTEPWPRDAGDRPWPPARSADPRPLSSRSRVSVATMPR